MGRRSRQKGKRGELELSKELTRLFGHQCRRGQQFCGANGDADVVGLPGVHIECKRTESLSLYTAMEQAKSDCGENVPIVCHRRNGKKWLVVVELEDLQGLLAAIAKKDGGGWSFKTVGGE
jgi:hypothetical protein